MTQTPIALLIASLAGLACSPVAPGFDDAHRPAPSAETTRIIIKMRDGARLAETYESLKRTAGSMDATLQYLRPLFEDVHLYELVAKRRDTVAPFLQAAATHPNVEYAEPDRILRHQPFKQQ